MRFGLSDEEYERIRSELLTDDFYKKLDEEAKARSAAFAERAAENESGIAWAEMAEVEQEEIAELLPAEILLLDRIDGKRLNRVSIPGYFTHDYHLNLGESVRRLFAGGFLRVSTPAKKGQSPKIEHTEAGAELLRMYSAVPYASSCGGSFGVSINEAFAVSECYPEMSKFAVIRFILERRAEESFGAGEYGAYRNALYGLSENYRIEGDVDSQKKLLMQCCYLDSIGAGNGGVVSGAHAGLAPRVISVLKEITSGLSPELFAEEFRNAALGCGVSGLFEDPEPSLKYATMVVQKELKK